MIALNELIKNRAVFEEKYRQKELSFDLDIIFLLEQKMKVLQEETEKMRANCNKLCGQIARLKNENKDTKKQIDEIVRLDKTIKANSKRLDNYLKIINKNLSKLHNIPVGDNTENIFIETSGNDSTIIGFENFLTLISKTGFSNLNILNELKSKKDMLLDVLPICHRCIDGYVLFCKAEHTEFLRLDIIDYLKLNSKKLCNVAVQKLGQSSNETYIAQINNDVLLQIDFTKEFYSREFNIKYHDQATDSTKFVNIIIAKIKPVSDISLE